MHSNNPLLVLEAKNVMLGISVRPKQYRYRLSADIFSICRYIGSADSENPLSVSVSADNYFHIGGLTDNFICMEKSFSISAMKKGPVILHV